MIKDIGNLGLLLRYKDQFNYYQLSFSSKGISYSLMHDGVLTEIKTSKESFEIGAWYRVWVTLEASDVTVRLEKESKPDLPKTPIDEMEVVFESEDHVHKSGYTALFSNGTRGAYFDDFYIESLECTDKQPEPSDLFFVPQDCNRFQENYKGGPLKLRWNILDPENVVEGPGKWKIASNIQGRTKAIYQ